MGTGRAWAGTAGAAPLHWGFGQTLTSIPDAHTAPKGRGSQPWQGTGILLWPLPVPPQWIPPHPALPRAAQAPPSQLLHGKVSGMLWSHHHELVPEAAPGVRHLQLPGEGTWSSPEPRKGDQLPVNCP